MKPPASLVAQMVKNLPAMWEAWVRSLDWEDALEKGMATHSSILAWRIPRTEEPDYSPWGCKESGHNWVTFTFKMSKVLLNKDDIYDILYSQGWEILKTTGSPYSFFRISKCLL